MYAVTYRSISIFAVFVQGFTTGSRARRRERVWSRPRDISSSARGSWTPSASPAATRRSATARVTRGERCPAPARSLPPPRCSPRCSCSSGPERRWAPQTPSDVWIGRHYMNGHRIPGLLEKLERQRASACVSVSEELPFKLVMSCNPPITALLLVRNISAGQSSSSNRTIIAVYIIRPL